MRPACQAESSESAMKKRERKLFTISDLQNPLFCDKLGGKNNAAFASMGGYTMHLQESGEMYLETILILSQRQRYVRSVDVADYMHFSKPSVSRAVSLLKQGEYLTVNSDGFLILTEAGREVAEKIYERHQVLSNIFRKLGVSEKNAVDDACRVEHVISDASFRAIKEHIKSKHNIDV